MQIVDSTTLGDMMSHIVMRMNMPLFVWGSPGIGKSETTASVAEKHNALLVDVRLSQYASVDLRGMPDRQDGKTVWYPPATMPFKGTDGWPTDRPILLFFDEANAAVPSVAAVAYQIVNDRRCGEHELMDNVRIVAAGNRESDKGVTNRMPTPLANRFIHVELGASVEAWAENFAIPAGMPPEGVAFLYFRKELLNNFDPTRPDKSFATPRSWEKAFTIHMDDQISESAKIASMIGAVGEGPVNEFMGFCSIWKDMIDFSDIVADPEGVVIPRSEEGSMKYALAMNCAGNMNADNCDAVTVFLQRLGADFTIMAWHLACKRDEKETGGELYGTDAFMKISQQYKAVFRQN